MSQFSSAEDKFVDDVEVSSVSFAAESASDDTMSEFTFDTSSEPNPVAKQLELVKDV